MDQSIFQLEPMSSYLQDSSNFYLLMSAKRWTGQGPWQLKRVNSTTGPYVGTLMSDAIRSPYSVTGQTEMLWIQDTDNGKIIRSCFL